MRLLTVYQKFLSAYATMRSYFPEFHFLQSIADYLSVWMVELTARPFTAWSETEIIRFLTNRIRQGVPPGLMGVMDKVHQNFDKNVTEIINYINQLNKKLDLWKQVILRSRMQVWFFWLLFFLVFL